MKGITSGEAIGTRGKRVGDWRPATTCPKWVLGACFFVMVCSLAAPAETVTAPLRQFGTGLFNKAAWSPDEKIIATCGPRGGVYLWDAATGERVRTFTGHTRAVCALAFSADGKWLVTGSNDLTVRRWEVATGRQIQVFSGHTDWITDVAISRDGTKILSGSRDKTARLWDVASGKLSATLTGHTGVVYAVAISPDGKKALTGCLGPDSSARLWDLATLKATYTMDHFNSVYTLAFSPDGKQVASAGGDNRIWIWSAETGQWSRSISIYFGTSPGVFSLAYSGDGATLYAGVEAFGLQGGTPGYNDTKYCVYACNPAQGSVKRFMAGNTDRIHSLAVSVDGARLMAGSSDGTARTWQAADGSPLQSLRLHSYRIDSLAFSPDRRTILAGEKDGTARMYDWRTGKQLLEIREAPTTVTALYPGIRRCAFSPSGALFLTSMPDGLVHVREADSGLPVATIDTGMDWWPDASFAKAGRQIYTSGPSGAILWNLDTGKKLRTYGTTLADGLVLSRDGMRLATWSGRTARIWNTQSGDLISTCTGGSNSTTAIMSMEFCPDGKLLVGYNDQTHILWDAGTGTRFKTFPLSAYSNDRIANIYSVAPSPDGVHFLSAGLCTVTSNGASYYGGMAWLWDIGSGSVLRTYDHPEQRNIYAAAFSPDGALLLTGSFDGAVLLWKSDPSQNAVGGWTAFE